MARLGHPSRTTSVLASEQSGSEEGLEGPWGQGALLATSGPQDGIGTSREPALLGHTRPASWYTFVDDLLCAAVFGELELPIHRGSHASSPHGTTGRYSLLFSRSWETTSLRDHLRKGHLGPGMSWAW